MQTATGSISCVAAQPSVLGPCGGGGGAPSAAARGTARCGGIGGRAVGVARCSARAQEKRPPRVRKTKEERRELVESFINNYRVSNDGKFPSVNLTHKEVGGSYYIVREIVRDIIQENKVLGPGGLNATMLTFEDCPDSSELSIKHELGQDTMGILQTSDDSKILHDSASEISNEEFPLQNNVISTQTLLGSSNLLEAGVLNRVVQIGNGASTTCLETSLEKQDKDPSSRSVEVDLNSSGEQGSPFAYVSVSDKETELENLGDTSEGVVSGVTTGVTLSPEPNSSYETNSAIRREHETLPTNSHHVTNDDAFNEVNLPKKATDILHTEQTTLQEHEALNGSVPSDDACIMGDQSSSQMDGFTLRTESAETEVTTKTVELSNEHQLQDVVEPSLLDSSHDEQENPESVVSQPPLDTMGLLSVEGKHSVLQVDENDLKSSTSGITTEEVEASSFKHDEGTSTTTTIIRGTSKAQKKKEENLFWLVLRAFVIAVSKLWTK